MFARYPVIDLTKIADEVFATHPAAGLVEWVFKYGHQPQFMNHAAAFQQFIQRYLQTSNMTPQQQERHLISIGSYLASEADITHDQQTAFFAIIKQSLPHEIGVKVMSLAQHWLQAGIEQGMQQGEHNLFRQLLIKRFGHAVHTLDQHIIDQADTTKILVWIERLPYVKNLKQRA